MSFVDLHLHLLPRLDDGPASVEESLAHARRMAGDGVLEAVVTPHVGHPDFPVAVVEIAARTEALQRLLRTCGIDLRLRPGGEVHPAALDRLTRAELEHVAQGPSGSRWVLVEPPFAGIDESFAGACDRLHGLGFGVLIAHPERCANILSTGAAIVRELRARGALLQVNASSLLGRHGQGVRDAAERLVRNGSAYVIASDGHGAHRADTVRSGYAAAVAAGVTPLHAQQLTMANPRFLLTHGLAPSGPRAPWICLPGRR